MRVDHAVLAFFTGKGGVGKTSLACASALKLAQCGKRVLLISTDPASNLDEVLNTALTGQPSPIAGVPGLDALNITPVQAAAVYRERLIKPMRGLLPKAALQSMEEQLSGSCTVEIAAFDEFSGWIGNPEVGKGYDHILFDTAPTGHTLRLMGLAKAWDQFLAHNTSGTSCLGPLAGLDKQRAVYSSTIRTLSDRTATTLGGFGYVSSKSPLFPRSTPSYQHPWNRGPATPAGTRREFP